MQTNPKRNRGFTLIELLVVISIIALLIAILLPSLVGARNEGQRLRALANMSDVGKLGQVHAAEFQLPMSRTNSASCSSSSLPEAPPGIMHPMATSGELNWLGLGAWDWGGGNGTDIYMFSGEGASPPGFASETRPLSRANNGGTPAPPNSDFSVFASPKDEGNVPSSLYDSDLPGGSEGEVLRSMFRAKGTSYQGDFIWYRTGNIGLRFGTFMRPQNRVPDAGQTLHLYESRFAQAMLHAQEFIDGGAFGGTAMTVPGWYGRLGEFNAVFADGHGGRILLRQRGDMFPINGYPIQTYPYREVMARAIAGGWRTDCFPAPFVREQFCGNP